MFNPFSVGSNSFDLMHSLADEKLAKVSDNLTDNGGKYAYFRYDGLDYRVIEDRDRSYRIYYYRSDKSLPWDRLCSFRKVGDEWTNYFPYKRS